MKTYPFILIDKRDMTKLHHFATADRCADAMYGKTGPQVAAMFLVVRNENVLVDFSDLAHDSSLATVIHRRVLEKLTAK